MQPLIDYSRAASRWCFHACCPNPRRVLLQDRELPFQMVSAGCCDNEAIMLLERT